MPDHNSTSTTTARRPWRLLATGVLFPLLFVTAGTLGPLVPSVTAQGRNPNAVITVNVSHPAEDGDVACALFADAEGFPADEKKSRGVVHPAQGTSATCLFDGVAPGTYAVAVLLDTNGNGKADTNFLGMPTEPWGVSNNARPMMRAPNFEEASFTVAPGTPLTLAVELK